MVLPSALFLSFTPRISGLGGGLGKLEGHEGLRRWHLMAGGPRAATAFVVSVGSANMLVSISASCSGLICPSDKLQSFSPTALPKPHSNNLQSSSYNHQAGLVTVQNP